MIVDGNDHIIGLQTCLAVPFGSVLSINAPCCVINRTSVQTHHDSLVEKPIRLLGSRNNADPVSPVN